MTGHSTTQTHTAQGRQHYFGMPVIAMAGLALLGIPRVVLHDLDLISGGSPVTWLLAVGPLAAWVAVTVLRRSPRPFMTVLTTGMMFGVMLVITHQLLWDVAFDGSPPVVGPGDGSALIPRIAAIPSGLVTGAAIGAIGGLVAWAVTAARKEPRKEPRHEDG